MSALNKQRRMKLLMKPEINENTAKPKYPITRAFRRPKASATPPINNKQAPLANKTLDTDQVNSPPFSLNVFEISRRDT
ncbi:unnamed protein product [Ambrosiozyma monospora]|uniref:Unnamed protein product n=1 Tax=Ambrosiozyma monospora TaxID=43982 RepID=A0ACB5U2F2_AMBMO|nr:unnamed protein product [Ambrosiozyma monospora]